MDAELPGDRRLALAVGVGGEVLRHRLDFNFAGVLDSTTTPQINSIRPGKRSMRLGKMV